MTDLILKDYFLSPTTFGFAFCHDGTRVELRRIVEADERTERVEVIHVGENGEDKSRLVEHASSAVPEQFGEGSHLMLLRKTDKGTLLGLIDTETGDWTEIEKQTGHLLRYAANSHGACVVEGPFLSAPPSAPPAEGFVVDQPLDLKTRIEWLTPDLEKTPMTLPETSQFPVSAALSKDGRIASILADEPSVDAIVAARSLALWASADAEPQVITTDVFLEQLVFSRDGRLWTVGRRGPDGEMTANNSLFSICEKTGQAQRVIGEHSFDVLDAVPTKDGFLLLVSEGVRNKIYQLQCDTDEVVCLREEAETIESLAVSPTTNEIFVLSRGAVTTPMVVGLHSTGPAREDNATLHESISWRSIDGVEIEGVFSRPQGIDGPQPCITYLHGGPHDAARFCQGNEFDATTAFVRHGFSVFRPNYRGSSGYGDDFYRGVIGDYFSAMTDDVMTGIDHLIETGLADEHRLGITGYSAGGALTKHLITQTDRFAAASAGAGASCWLTMYLSGDLRAPRHEWFRSKPHFGQLGPAEYWYQSPLAKAANVVTPLILFYGTDDLRNPSSEGRLFYEAIKLNGIETVFYQAQGCGHTGWPRWQAMEKARIEIAWFQKHLAHQSAEAPSEMAAE